MIEILGQNILFCGISQADIGLYLEKIPVSILRFHKEETVLAQGDPYTALYLLLKGRCFSRMLDYRGRELKIEHFSPGIAFAPAVLFASVNDMPGSVIADSETEIAVLSRESVLELCRINSRFLLNFIGLLSDKFLFISHKLEAMSFRTIREKVANYLLGLHADDEGLVHMPMTIENLASFFGVSRPSLSRVFGSLERDGIIAKQKQGIEIIDIDALVADSPDE